MRTLILALAAFIGGQWITTAEINVPPPGFTPLFKGENLDGWWGLDTSNPRQWMALSPEELAAKQKASQDNIHRHWTVEDGILINDGQGLYLTTLDNYGDFELWLDYKLAPGTDSGVYVRGIPQVQIWDHTEEGFFHHGADKGSGGLWNNRKNPRGRDPLVVADRPIGEWNRMRIIMVGERVTVYLNDMLVVDHAIIDNFFDPNLPVQQTGPIQLQTHGGRTWWRNIFIREIESEEANERLSAWESDGFVSVFNGETFDGWSGATEDFEVVDGELRCRQTGQGTIFTEQEYGDFIARLEFQLPPGGHSGLAIRYPGRGHPAFAGMTEIQILDDAAPKHANLDPRQYHGSAYGMVAAHRGYLRPIGTWNFKEITVSGHTIRVELNGTVILDGDLDAVTEFMKDADHPGRTLQRGHFGITGYRGPVVFRNIYLKAF